MVRQSGESIMLLGCFSSAGTGAVVKIIQGIMDSARYQDHFDTKPTSICIIYKIFQYLYICYVNYHSVNYFIETTLNPNKV